MTTEYIFEYRDAQEIKYDRLRFIQQSQNRAFGIFQQYGSANLVELELARVTLNEVGESMSAEARLIRAAGGVVDMWNDVVRFHQHYKIDYDGPPRVLDPGLEKFRRDFMREEHKEFDDATNDALRFDACLDLIYVVLGYCRLRGWNVPEGWRRVHRANMLKKLAEQQDPKRHGMDVIKPPGWVAPNHDDLVAIVAEITRPMDKIALQAPRTLETTPVEEEVKK